MATALPPQAEAVNSEVLNMRNITVSPTIPTKLSTTNTDLTLPSQPKHNSTSYITQLQQQGYVVIPSILSKHLLLAAQASSKYLLNKTRPSVDRRWKLYWPYVRTVPKQYPPWPNLSEIPPDDLATTNIWGIQHLLHPDLKDLRNVFAEIYFNDSILNVIRSLLADPSSPDQPVSTDDLVLELFNMLVSPAHSSSQPQSGEGDFDLEWHRDDIRATATLAEESALLESKAPGGRQLHAQYNLALQDDSSLIVVPGSHRRARTDTERTASRYAALPDQVTVHLKAGDAVFYDSNILHRGSYKSVDPSEELGRLTLHGSVGLKGYGNERARQVLQHGVKWFEREDSRFEGIADEQKRMVAEGMRERLVAMGTGRDEIEFSQEG